MTSIMEQMWPNGKGLRGRGTSVTKCSWDLSMHTHSMRHSNQILHVDQTISENNFYRLTTPPALAENLCDMNGDA